MDGNRAEKSDVAEVREGVDKKIQSRIEKEEAPVAAKRRNRTWGNTVRDQASVLRGKTLSAYWSTGRIAGLPPIAFMVRV